MAAVRNIIVRVGADASTLQKTLQKSQTDLKKFGSAVKETGTPMQGLKGELDKLVKVFPALGPVTKVFDNMKSQANGVIGPIKNISPEILAIGAAAAAAVVGIGLLIKGATDLAHAFWDVGMKYDTAFNKIQFKTAETGVKLAGLKDSFKNIYTSTASSTDDITNAMVAVNQRLGLTGKAFDDLVKGEMRYAKVSDTDVKETVLTTTRLFGDWGIKAKNYIKTLDMMYVATAKTGVPTQRLNELMVTFGGPMRQLGFSFESAAALLGKFEKEGVNTELVMGAMRRGLGKWSKDGKNVEQALNKIIDKIKSAGSAGKANALAIETFGIKAGPDMAAAIREGRFNIAELTNTLKTNKITLAGVAGETATFAGKWEVAKRRVEGILEPIGVKLVDALQAKLFPVIKDVTDAIVIGLDPAMEYLAGSTDKSKTKIKGHTKAIQEEYPWLKDTKKLLDDLNKAFNDIDLKQLISDMATITANIMLFANRIPKALNTLRLLATAFYKTGETISGILIDISPFEESIALMQKITSTEFRESVVNNIKLGTNNIIKFFKQLAIDIPNSINNVINSVKTWGSNMITNITTFVGNVKTSIVTGFNKVVAFFQALPGRLATILLNLFTVQIPHWIGFGLGRMIALTGQYLTNMMNFYISLPGRIAGIFNNIIAAVSTWGINMYNIVITEAPKIINSIINFFVSLPGKISSVFMQVVNAVTTWGINAYTAVTTETPKIINGIVNFFVSLPGKVAKFFSDIISGIMGWGNNGAAQASTASTKVAKGITTPITSLPAKMAGFGKDIVNGLINGITGFAKNVASTAATMAKNFSEGFKAGLDIGSPSKVFAYYGKMITAGLIQGVKKDKEGVKQAITDIVNSLMQNTRKLMDFGGLFGKTTMQRFTGQDFIRGMKSQLVVLNSWKKSIETLGVKLGAKSPLFQELLKLGPESAGQLRAMAGMSAAQLKEYQGLYNQKSNIAMAWGGIMTKGEIYGQRSTNGIVVNITGNTIAKDYDIDKLMDRAVNKMKMAGVY